MTQHAIPDPELVLPLHLEPAADAHDHWAIVDAAGTIHACPHQAPTPALWALIHQAASSEPASTAGSDASASPTVPKPRRPQPRGTPAGEQQPLRFHPPALEAMDRAGITEQTVAEVLASPTHTEPGRRGATVVYGRHLRIVVGDDGMVLVVADRAPYGASTRSGTPAVRGTKHDPRAPRPQTVADYQRRLQDHGFVITPGSKHPIVTHPKVPGVQLGLPSTPSDHRGLLNHAAEIRSLFGIDVLAPGS